MFNEFMHVNLSHTQLETAPSPCKSCVFGLRTSGTDLQDENSHLWPDRVVTRNGELSHKNLKIFWWIADRCHCWNTNLPSATQKSCLWFQWWFVFLFGALLAWMKASQYSLAKYTIKKKSKTTPRFSSVTNSRRLKGQWAILKQNTFRSVGPGHAKNNTFEMKF